MQHSFCFNIFIAADVIHISLMQFFKDANTDWSISVIRLWLSELLAKRVVIKNYLLEAISNLYWHHQFQQTQKNISRFSMPKGYLHLLNCSFLMGTKDITEQVSFLIRTVLNISHKFNTNKIKLVCDDRESFLDIWKH